MLHCALQVYLLTFGETLIAIHEYVHVGVEKLCKNGVTPTHTWQVQHVSEGKGEVAPIKVKVDKRQGGRKHVTAVTGLEGFGIVPDVFGKFGTNLYVSNRMWKIWKRASCSDEFG